MAYSQAGEPAKAIEQLDKAIDLDPDLESAYRRLGDIYLNGNNLVGLRQTLERYLQAMPNNLTAIQALEDLDSKSHTH
jgi:tetratricopeptide (TPR) repeat protein